MTTPDSSPSVKTQPKQVDIIIDMGQWEKITKLQQATACAFDEAMDELGEDGLNDEPLFVATVLKHFKDPELPE